MEKDFKKRMEMVYGGLRCSQFGEVSEALFLTQDFVFNPAEEAQNRF